MATGEGLGLTLLGTAEVRLNGELITSFGSAKTQALLFYLAVASRTHSRPTLAGLLWADMPEADARANLRQVLTKLRRILAPHLDITRQTVAFDRDSAYWLDVEEFQTKVADSGEAATDTAVELLREAAGLYRGDFLAGFYVRDAPLFEEWALTQQTQLRTTALQALHKLSRFFAQRGDYENAIVYTRRLLVLEPWDESAHRDLMRLLAWGGQRGAALAQYETCRRTLEEELGVEPSEETAALYELIRTGERNSRQSPPG
jgi:DNA-binding SARP family transcriptional activator